MTINVNGNNATGINVTGGTVIGTQNNESHYYGGFPLLFARPVRRLRAF